MKRELIYLSEGKIKELGRLLSKISYGSRVSSNPHKHMSLQEAKVEI